MEAAYPSLNHHGMDTNTEKVILHRVSIHRSVLAGHTVLTAERNKGGVERQEVRKTGKKKYGKI